MRFSSRWLLQFLLQVLLVLAFALQPTTAIAQEDSGSDDGESSDEEDDESAGTSGDSAPGEAKESGTPGQSPGEVETPEPDDEAEDGAAAADRVRSTSTPGRRSPKRTPHKAAAQYEKGHRRFAAGFRGTGLAAIRRDREPGGLAGLGAFVELMAVQGDLQLELGARLLTDGKGLQVPVALLLKKPWDLARARVYIGVGPAVVVAVALPAPEALGGGGPETGQGVALPPAEVHFGFSGVAGMTYWVRERVGFNLELNYNIVLHGGPVHEIGSSAGLLFVL